LNASAPLVTRPRTRPGRPRKAESAAIDARILEAGWQIFVENGFESASMEAIAERAGVTRMTLYQRHEDRLALFRAVITGQGDAWARVSERTVWMKGATLAERLGHFARTVIGWSHNPDIVAARRLSHGARGAAGQVAEELEMLFRHKMIEMLAADIADYSTREARRPSDPHEFALFLIGMIEAVAREGARASHSLATQEAQAARAVEILLQGTDAR
jgi:AcrR family transcriptional regulator